MNLRGRLKTENMIIFKKEHDFGWWWCRCYEGGGGGG